MKQYPPRFYNMAYKFYHSKREYRGRNSNKTVDMTPESYRLGRLAYLYSLEDIIFKSDSILSHEIPRSASTTNWMSTEREHIKFLSRDLK